MEKNNNFSKEVNSINPIETLKFKLIGETQETSEMELTLESIEVLQSFLSSYALLLK
jgi:hypothetical protein